MDNTAEELKNINKTLEKILDAMPKPAGRFQRVLETILLFVGIFGSIVFIDIIVRWIYGG